jgi:hypothetical protein
MAKSIRVGMTILAAAALAAVAQGQSAYKATIPFAFQAGRTPLTAGAYELRPESRGGSPVVSLRNVESGKTVLVAVAFPKQTDKWMNPQLQFRCRSGQCVMDSLWRGGSEGWVFAAPRKNGAGPEYTASVRLEH